MALIRSESLRDALAEYYTRIDYWEDVMERASVEHEYSLATAGVPTIDHMAAIERSDPRTGPTDLGVVSEDAVSIAEQLKSRTQGTRLLPIVYKSHSLVTIVIAEHRERNEAIRQAALCAWWSVREESIRVRWINHACRVLRISRAFLMVQVRFDGWLF